MISEIMIQIIHYVVKSTKLVRNYYLVKNEHIRVAADPFNIADKFEHNNCTSETLEIYKNFIFVEYFKMSFAFSIANS